MSEEKRGYCGNYGQCSKADSKETFIIKDSDNPVCPECQMELSVHTAGRKERIKKYTVLISIFFVITVLPWLFVTQLFSTSDPPPPPPVKPADLESYYIGTVSLSDNQTKTALLRIYKVEETSSQTVYYYTINLNAVEGRIDSLGLVIPKEKRIFVPDIGFLSYERTHNNRIILKSVDQFKKPFWSFEEAKR